MRFGERPSGRVRPGYGRKTSWPIGMRAIPVFFGKLAAPRLARPRAGSTLRRADRATALVKISPFPIGGWLRTLNRPAPDASGFRNYARFRRTRKLPDSATSASRSSETTFHIPPPPPTHPPNPMVRSPLRTHRRIRAFFPPRLD